MSKLTQKFSQLLNKSNTITHLSQQCKHTNTYLKQHFSTHVGAPLRKKVTTIDLQKYRNKNKPITMCTAYTYPSAVHVDTANIDVLLIGDSCAMVELGHDTTLPITVEQMLYHCQAVARGAQHSLLVADMPFGSYEASAQMAYNTAVKFLKEGGVDAVKLEGGESRADTVKLLCDGGVAVMGHIGLTPQRISILGGFRAQGKSLDAAEQLIKDAIALEQAGAFSLVIECVPAIVAKAITEAISIPTIGIGAGKYCSGQVLVYHDLLGMFQHAHHAAVTPSFCKQYAHIGELIQKGLDAYVSEVESRQFPSDQYSPYKIAGEQTEIEHRLTDLVQKYKKHGVPKNITGALNVQQADANNGNNDDTIKVY